MSTRCSRRQAPKAGIDESEVLEPDEYKVLRAAGTEPEAGTDESKGQGPKAGSEGIPESAVMEHQDKPGTEQYPEGAPLCFNGQGLGGTDKDFPGRRQDAEGAGKHNPAKSARPPGQDGIGIIGFWRPALRTCIFSFRARSIGSCRRTH